MARITIQMGHCFRTRGATGTRDEQRFASTVGPRLREALIEHGHVVRLIGADMTIPSGDVFISLHCDGSSNRSRRGASIGYPAGYNGALGKSWKHHHGERFPGGWLADNYTIGLRRYYSWPHRSSGATRSKGYRHWHLAEHGTTTNDHDHAWLFGHLDECIQAHVDAIGDVIGHPHEAPTDVTSPEVLDTMADHVAFIKLAADGRTLKGVTDRTEYLLDRTSKTYKVVPTASARKTTARLEDVADKVFGTFLQAEVEANGYRYVSNVKWARLYGRPEFAP